LTFSRAKPTERESLKITRIQHNNYKIGRLHVCSFTDKEKQ
jgi:hypothetical protein